MADTKMVKVEVEVHKKLKVLAAQYDNTLSEMINILIHNDNVSKNSAKADSHDK